MKNCVFLFIAIMLMMSCSRKELTVTSPDSDIRLSFAIDNDTAKYSVSYKGKNVLNPSSLGFQFQDAKPLQTSLKISEVRKSAHDSTWKPVWGAESSIRNHYNEVTIELREKKSPKREINLIFRVYNDGIGFRYVFPEQDDLDKFSITGENTEFKFAGDNTTWWQIANYDSYEYTFAKTPLSELGSQEHLDETEYGADAFGESVPGAANTPVTMKTDEDLYLSIHEADLTDYAGMTLELDTNAAYTLKSALVPWPDGKVKVKAEAPHKTPWRTIQIAENAGGLIESHLIKNLNEPNALENTEWIEPGKYCGVWWSLHIGKNTWSASPTHGANTDNVMRYVNFAGKHDIPYVIAEGWNKYGALSAQGGEVDFITPADDFNLKKILNAAQANDTRFMAYNETGCQVERYGKNWDTTFAFYQKNNIGAIKTGHVGDNLAGKHHHHSQWGVNYYQGLIEKTAQYHIGLMVHEPVKPTGKVRTYPHYLTREGVAGMEQDKFEDTDPREHTVEVPFTRMLAGPLDYMPGIFDNTLEDYEGMQVQSTVARQLAYYPVFLSGLKCVTDLPENYRGKPAFQFITDVPVTWDKTKVINGKIGNYITIARKKDNEWYLGSLTDEKARKINIPLNFLDNGEYIATVYADGEEAHAVSNPDPVKIEKYRITHTDTLKAEMVSGGGQAVKISPAE